MKKIDDKIDQYKNNIKDWAANTEYKAKYQKQIDKLTDAKDWITANINEQYSVENISSYNSVYVELTGRQFIDDIGYPIIRISDHYPPNYPKGIYKNVVIKNGDIHVSEIDGHPF